MSTSNATSGGIEAAISAGDIARTVWPAEDPHHLNLYLGSGRCGGCFDRWGLMNVPRREGTVRGNNPTHLMHADFWNRDAHGIDQWQPVYRLRWFDRAPAEPTKYEQRQSLYDGKLTTDARGEGYRLRTSAAFDPYHRDVLGIAIDYECAAGRSLPAVLLSGMLDLELDGLKRSLRQIDCSADEWRGELSAGTARARLTVRQQSESGSLRFTPVADGLRIDFLQSSGRHLILIGAGAPEREAEVTAQMDGVSTADAFFARASAGWEKRFGQSFVHLPEPNHQAMWARSLAYVLSSYGPDAHAPAPPMGWAGMCWRQDFPQDLSYIHPALLRLGHLDIARAWIEFHASCIETATAFTRRVWNVAGTFWPWNMPMTGDAALRIEETPADFQYQLHNAGYPARMAYETALMLRDEDWSRRIAWPIVRGSATFYASILSRQGDGPDAGRWEIRVTPASGQDEAGGNNAPNYLDALFSARYTLQTALRMAGELQIDLPEAAAWRQMLDDGLAFETLIDPALGIYSTNENTSASKTLGREKHPVQLGPLAFLPGPIDPPTQRAYQQYRKLCEADQTSNVWGWTLPMYWLAAVRAGDPAILQAELRRSLVKANVDAEWIQIYESGTHWWPFYVTSHGLYLQAVHDAFVSDFYGPTRFDLCRDGVWQGATYDRLLTLDGQLHSG